MRHDPMVAAQRFRIQHRTRVVTRLEAMMWPEKANRRSTDQQEYEPAAGRSDISPAPDCQFG